MNLTRLIVREICYHKLNFALGVLSVLVAVGCLVAELSLLDRHDRETEQIIAAKEKQTETMLLAHDERTREMLKAHDERTRMIVDAQEAETKKRTTELEEAFRKINLSFNLLILPKDQNLADLYADDFAVKDMPEEYAQKLVKAKVITINHVLPTLQQKLKWPEQERTIILVGIRGEVLIQSARQKPILDTVPAGKIVLGHELHRSLKARVGDKVKLLGREFEVVELQLEKGTKDDITVWINLAEAQELLGKKGRINGILALECGCAADRLAKIREEVGAVLPDTQVVEYASQAVTRAESRDRAAVEAVAAIRQVKESRAKLRHETESLQAESLQKTSSLLADALQKEKDNRAMLRQQREAFAAVVIPVVLLGAALWIGFLALANVRERKNEIGILRAIGLGARQILCLFLGKAVLVGFLGAALGYLAGALVEVLAGWRGSGIKIGRASCRERV